jgi:hypothetical protein
MTSILDKTIGEGRLASVFKLPPQGRYLLRGIDTAFRTAGDKEVAELKCKIIAPADDLDVSGIKLDKIRVRGTIWLGTDDLASATRTVLHVNPGLPDIPLRDAISEHLTDTDFIAVLFHKKRAGSDFVDVEIDWKATFKSERANQQAAAAD